jgi:hypothetical protein
MSQRDYPHSATPALLRLKDAPRRERLTRLLRCGTLDLNRGHLRCTVFLKRSRAGNAQLREMLQSLKPRPGGAARARSRRGAFLRLVNHRSH